MTASRILIVRLSALGDVVHVLPALAALRQALPDAHLGWLVEDKAASLLAGHPQLDRVHALPRKAWTHQAKRGALLGLVPEIRERLAEVKAEGYEVALDFQSNFRSSLLTYLSGARRRIGQPARFSKEGSRLFFTDTPEPVPASAHKIVRNLQLLRPLGISAEDALRPSLAVEDCPPLPAGDGPWALIHPGVSLFGALKAWREERFAELGRALVADGVQVLFAWGGARERILAERLVAATPGALLAPSTPGLLGFATLLRRVDLVIGVDSGPLHLAGAVGTPTLGLYGPKHPETYGPFWPGSRVVRAGLECSPCRYRRCPRPEAAEVETPEGRMRISPCMDALSVAAAAAAAREMLAARPDPG